VRGSSKRQTLSPSWVLIRSPALGQGQEVAIDRDAIHAVAGQPLGQLGVARRDAQLGQLAQHGHPLLRDAQPARHQELAQVVVA
jgi:hypothetical protein